MARFLDQIPGYWDAVEAEGVGRDTAYLCLPKLVAGFALRPLTLRDYLRLAAVRSPFVCGGDADWDDACFLFWHQRARPAWLPTWLESRQRFSRRVGRAPLGEVTAACGEYVALALVDAPGGGPRRASYYSFGAALVHACCHAYPGTTRDEVLDTPLDQLLQEFRCIQESRNPHVIHFNRSDRLKGDFLRNLNQQRAEEVVP